MSQTVHVLSINGEYGPDISVHATEAGAKRRLAAFVNENWFEFIDEPCPAPLSEEDIERFFDEADGQMSWSLTSERVED